MNNDFPLIRHPETGALLSAVLSGERRDVATVADELGLSKLELARGIVSYRLSPSYDLDLDDTLRRFGVTGDDFDTATLLASAEWEDNVELEEHLLRVYRDLRGARPILAHLARLLAGQRRDKSPLTTSQLIILLDLNLIDKLSRESVLDLVQQLPVGFNNVVLEEVQRQSVPATSTAYSDVQRQTVPTTDVVYKKNKKNNHKWSYNISLMLMADTAQIEPDGPALERFARELAADPEQAERVERLTWAIHLLLNDGQDYAPPPGLAHRTIQFVTEASHRRRSILDFVSVTVPFRLRDIAVAASIFLAGLLMLIPAVHRSQQQQGQVGCAFNLNQLGLALAQYGLVYPFVSDQNRFLPTGGYAVMLHEAGLLSDLSLLDCPSADHIPPTSLPSFESLAALRPSDTTHYQTLLLGDYAYNVSYRNTLGRVEPIQVVSFGMIPLLADQPDQQDVRRIQPGNSSNHSDRGQNVIYSDLHVSWYSTRRISPTDDDMFLNDIHKLAPGLSKQDIVLLPPRVPFRGWGEPSVSD